MNARSLSGINDVTSNGNVALTMNARSMSGINDTFGGGGDVFQAGNPNTFTGTNTFNSNRPTSTLATTPGSNDFITKSDGEALFTSSTGDVTLAGNPNAFTGTNTFNTNRPTSTLATTPGSTDFITKQDGEALFTNNTGDVTLAGNPNTFTGTNTFNTNRPTSTLATTPGTNDFITKSDGEALFTNNTGDVTLAGNPNAFTGTNTFNTNRPTSTLATTPGTNDFITKSDGESLFTNNTGDALLAGGTEASPQTFTEFNKFDKLTKFNTTRPQLVVAGTTANPTANDFITKQDGDDLYASDVGAAILNAGTEASPQTFTGVNTFDSVNLDGNVFTENGNGQFATPYRRTVAGNTFVTAANGNKFVKIGTIPASVSDSKDFIKVVLTGGVWGSPPMIITAWFNNRDGFRYMYKKEGNIQTFISLFAVRPGPFGGTIEIWFFVAGGAGQYSRATWNVETVEGEVFKYPTSQSSPPTTTLMFDSNSASNPPNLVTEQAGITGHSFKAGFNDVNKIPPGAVDYALGQGQVFKPDVVAFNYGNCYSISSGKFTAKIKGVYAFKFSAYTNQSYNDFSRPTLFRNNIQWQTTGGRIANNGNQVYSNIYLDVGDYVTVKSTTGALYLYSNFNHNQFCGHLIHAVI